MTPAPTPDFSDSQWRTVGQFVASGFFGSEQKKRRHVTVQTPRFASSGYYASSEKKPRRLNVQETDHSTPSMLDIDLTYFEKPAER